jgi:hypothetical protein
MMFFRFSFQLEAQILKTIENNKEKYNLLLRRVTDKIMKEISKLSQKPYNYAD